MKEQAGISNEKQKAEASCAKMGILPPRYANGYLFGCQESKKQLEKLENMTDSEFCRMSKELVPDFMKNE